MITERSKIGAVILAAGASTRFGKPKQLAKFRGETLLAHAVSAATSAGCAPVVVVAGEHADDLKAALTSEACEFVLNHEWREGIAASIRTGLQHLVTTDHDLEAILFLACDQPLVSADNLRELIRRQETSGKSIVASAYAKTLGIPTLFARVRFPELLTLNGDRGAKELIFAHRDDVAAFDLPAAATDIDTAADYERLCQLSS